MSVVNFIEVPTIYELFDGENRRNYDSIDATRFKRRIAFTEKILKPIFECHHRQRVYRRRFVDFLIIDIQGFNIPQFTPKELCYMDSNRSKFGHFLFKPAVVSFQQLSSFEKKQIRWLQNNYSHIEYSSGNVAYEDMDIILKNICHSYNKIYVKGHQKYDFVKKFTNNVINLERYDGVPNFEKTITPCSYHKNNGQPSMCAKNNVELMYEYLCGQFF